MRCASEKWREIFLVNELSFEILDDSRTSSKDIPMYIARNVLKYPEQVKELMDNGFWWTNYEVIDEIRSGLSFEFGDHELKYKKKYFSPLINELIKFYNAQDVIPIEFYGNCYSGNKDLYTTMAYLPHVDTYPGADEDINPLNDYAFNLNLTKSDKVKTAFYSFNNKRSICNFTKRDFDDLEIVRQKHESIEVKDWKKELADEDYENFKLEYISNIDYNSMVIYPSHHWHSVYMKEDWFTDIDRITLTGFFETIVPKVKKTKKLGFG